MIIELAYWYSLLYINNEGGVFLGIFLGFGVLILFSGVDTMVLFFLIIMWPCWNVIFSFYSSFEIIGVVINELKKLLTLVLVVFIPLFLLVFLFTWFKIGLLGIISVSIYMVIGVSQLILGLVAVTLYFLLLNGWRYFSLGLMPLPFIFLKVGRGYILYLVIFFGFILFL